MAIFAIWLFRSLEDPLGSVNPMAEVEANLATFASEIPPRNLQARSEIHCQHPRHGSSSESLELEAHCAILLSGGPHAGGDLIRRCVSAPPPPARIRLKSVNP